MSTGTQGKNEAAKERTERTVARQVEKAERALAHDEPPAEGCVVAYVGEGVRYEPLVERAIEVARSHRSRLILFDADASSKFSSPLPTWWSADGQEQFGERLAPVDLEKAGRPELQRQVERARSAGVDAYGWLPDGGDSHEFADYAHRQHATLLVIPSEFEEKHALDKLRGRPRVDEIAGEAHLPILEVELPQD